MAFSMRFSLGTASPTAIDISLNGVSQPGYSNSGGGEPGTESVSISVIHEPNNAVAPALFFLEATATGFPDIAAPTANQDESKILIDYIWDAGNPGETYSAPQRPMRDINNANAGIGPLFAAKYTSPGSYSPSVTAVMWSTTRGGLVTATATIASPLVVQDVNTVYTNIAFVDPDGDYTGSPATGGQNYTSLSAAVDAITGETNTQIRFRSGKTYTQTTGYNWSGLAGSLYLAPHGEGARPVIDGASIPGAMFFFTEYDPTQTKDFIADGIRFQKGWNEITETGGKYLGWQCGGTDPVPNYMFIHDAEVHGFSAFFSHSSAAVPPLGVGIHYCDVTFTSKGDFTLLGSHEFITITGCRDVRDPLARSGGTKADAEDQNEHSGSRYLARRSVFAKNDTGQWAGWFDTGARYLGQTLFVPNCGLRLNTEPVEGAIYSVVENILEGGDEIMHLSSANFRDYFPLSYIIDSNVMISTWGTVRAIGTAFTCGRIANNLWFIPNIDLTGGGQVTGVQGPRHFVGADFAFGDTPNTAENAAGTIYVVNNSIINFGTNALTSEIDPVLDAAFTVINDRNIYHQPSAGGTDWGLDFSAMFEAAKTENFRYSGTGDTPGSAPVVVPGSATPAGSVQLPTPAVGSSARDAHAGSLYTTRDFNKNVRTLPDWTGAVSA